MRIGIFFVFVGVLVFAFNSINAAACPAPITAPGTYVMPEDYVGAPNPGIIVSGYACVKIASSDVVFDCNGHKIYNSGVPFITYGILVVEPAIKNVTVKNCASISGYTHGVFFNEMRNSTARQIVVNDNDGGFTIAGGRNITIINNTALSNQNSGILIYSLSSHNTIEDNIVRGSNIGIFMDFTGNNAVKNNRIYNSIDYGILITHSSRNNFTGNTLENQLYGIHGEGSYHNYFYNNVLKNTAETSFHVIYSGNTTLIKNKAINSTTGFVVERSENCTFKHNIASGILEQGFAISILSNRAVMDNNTAYNSRTGLLVDTANDVVIHRLKTYNNKDYGVYLLDSYGTKLTNSIIYNSSIGLYTRSLDLSASISTTNLTIGGPLGTAINATTLNIADTLSKGENFSIRWVKNTYPLPPGRSSFRGKFVNITGNGTISKIEWLWASGEVAGYDEESFQLAKNDGNGWVHVNALLNIAENKLTVSGLVPASMYGILGNGTDSNYTLASIYKANVTDRVDLERWKGIGSTARANIEGGNVSDFNIIGATLTQRWAAFYGNIIGSIYLTSKIGDLLNYLYKWDWTPAQGGSVCVSTNSSMLNINVTGATGRDVDLAWGFGNVADNGKNTFRGFGCNLSLGTANVTGADYADTGTAKGFRTCSLKTKKSPTKENMLFCTEINESGIAFNGEPANFELIVPFSQNGNIPDTYYFYATLG
ncbi:MAG: right-handed parallel beta-helix repeat-containing protein [Candidatus Micrarchaeota archaeon]|nr:right-handed parallel beta-helix repeat-containing protein [Candidatus Micrarchaeota archaeon]